MEPAKEDFQPLSAKKSLDSEHFLAGICCKNAIFSIISIKYIGVISTFAY